MPPKQSSADALRAFEVEFAGKQIFTRELLEEAAEIVDHVREYLKSKDPSRKHAQTFYIHGIDPGVRIPWTTSDDSNNFGSAHLSWWKYGTMALDRAAGPYIIGHGWEKDEVASCNTLPVENCALREEVTALGPPDDKGLELVAEMKRLWTESTQWATLQTKLAALAGKHRIKNFVCMALASVYSRNEELEDEELEDEELEAVEYDTKFGFKLEPLQQHLVACCMADFLNGHYAKSDPSKAPIEIIAYDPEYRDPDLRLFPHLPVPIKIVSDPYHFFAITPETLVIQLFCPILIPNYEIIGDLLFPSGPAAIFCNDIEPLDEKYAAGGHINPTVDQWSPRVGKLLSMYEKTTTEDLGWDQLPSDITDFDLEGEEWLWLKSKLSLYTRKVDRLEEIE